MLLAFIPVWTRVLACLQRLLACKESKHRKGVVSIRGSLRKIFDNLVVLVVSQTYWNAQHFALRRQFRTTSGHESRDAAAFRIRIRIGLRNVKNQNLANQRPFFPFLAVGSHGIGLEVPKRAQFHAAIRVAPKHCDSCVQGALQRNLRDAESKSLVFTETFTGAF